jgi:hypothetical protein
VEEMTTQLQLAIIGKKKAIDFMRKSTKEYYELVEVGKLVRINKKFIKFVHSNVNGCPDGGVRIYYPDGTIRFIPNHMSDEIFGVISSSPEA